LVAVLIALMIPALSFASVHRSAAKPTPRPTSPMTHTSLRLAMPDTQITVDPALAVDEDNAELASLLYSGLVRLDAHYHVVPDAASHYVISRDHRTYTFYLRDGLRFSDGDPITAADFLFSITRSLGSTLRSSVAPTYLFDIVGAKQVYTGKAKRVVGLRVVDNNRAIQITVRWPVPYFLTELAYPISYVLDRKAIAKFGPPDNTGWYASPVSSGPFHLKSMDPGSKLVLQRNPYYAGPQPNVRTISISLQPLSGSGLQLYQWVSRNLDVSNLPAYDAPLLHQPGVQSTPMLAIAGIYMRLTSAPFDNVHVRRALTLALNRKTVVARQMGPWVTPFTGYVPPGESGYDSTLPVLPYNPALAARELALAGYPGGKGFPPITLYYGVDPNSPNQTVALAIEHLIGAISKSWKRVLKITVATHELKITNLVTYAQTNSLPIYVSGWTADYPDAHDWLSEQWETHALNNNVGYSNKRFDDAVMSADVTWRAERRARLYNEAQQMLVNDAAWIPLYIPHRLVYIRPSVNNLYLTGYGVIPRQGSWAQVRVRSAAPSQRAN
jgi:oligopeptide transport system substrate-binding protein